MLRLRSRKSDRRGFALMAYALMVFTLVGFTGLAVDVGFVQFEKRKLQAAADAASMGALREMERGNTDYTAAAQNDASLNGFTNGQNNTTVTVNNPPTSGTYANDSSAIQVSVQRIVPTFFMRVFGQDHVTIGATATARTSTTNGSIGGCIFALDPTADGALTVNGGATITTACSAVVESSSANAFEMGGTSSWSLSNGATIGVVGPGTKGEGWDLFGNYVLDSTTGQNETPVNIVKFSDPLEDVAAPTPSGLNLLYSDPTHAYSENPNTTNTLNPGIYCGGITIQGTDTLTPGVYVLAGGGMRINSGANVSVSTPSSSGAETGVMFYNTSSDSQSWGCQSHADADELAFNGNATINLAGLSTTSPVAVLFYDDQKISGLSHTINGTSTSTFDGAMYFKKNSVSFKGTNKTPGFEYIVANTITFIGTSSLGNDHSDLANVYTIAPYSTGGGLVQ